MMNTDLKLRAFAAIRRSLVPSKQSSTLPATARPIVGDDYRRLVGLGRQTLASDFIFLDVESAIAENTLTELPRCELGVRWWAFGKSGSGDLWSLRKTGGGKTSEVAFIDHDDEFEAKPKVLSISLEDWFRLADLIRQVEDLVRETPSLRDRKGLLKSDIKKAVSEQMEALRHGLSRRYPYRM